MVSLDLCNLYVHHYFKESYTRVPHPEPSSLHLWRFHFDIWQNQYNILKLKKKHIKKKNRKGKAKKNHTKQTNKNKQTNKKNYHFREINKIVKEKKNKTQSYRFHIILSMLCYAMLC